MAENKDVQFKDEDFAALLDEFDSKETEGAFCEGKIVSIKDDEIFVDVGRKSEGVLNANEVTDENGNLSVKVGDTIRVAITGSRGGKPIVSYRKALKKVKVAEFIDNYDENAENLVDIKIVGKNKGGYVCTNKEGVEFFMPRSQCAFKDSNSAVGKSYKVKVISVDKDKQSILVSRKKILDDQRKAREEVIANLPDIIEGTVKKITNYGMFVDVGGVDGLVHYSEISYKGPVNPSTLYKEGDKVVVKKVEYDENKKHLSLSIKATLPDPWDEIKDEECGLEVGDTIKVIVSNIEPYGAFVDLGNDIEGFLHISEISWDKNIKNPKDFIKEGDEIDVEVIEINPNERRLRVSLKNLLKKPFDEFKSKYKTGDVIKGVITTVTAFGAFIKIDMVEGLLHNEDISWNRNDRCKDLLKAGDEIKVKIIKIDDESEKISLSQKELLDSPTKNYAKTHGVGDIVKGKIKDIKDFGLFVELEENIDALIRKEDLGNTDEASLKVGDEIEAAIDFIDEKSSRIRLSVKRLARQKERETINEINGDDEKQTLGDLIKEQLNSDN